MLTGCAKNEMTTPGGNAPAEITFTTAPITKGLAAGQSTFATTNVFETYAWYSAKGFNYTAAGAEEYVPASIVSYGDNCWKIVNTPYFWPKDGGTLSFFSWSLNKGDLEFASASATTPVSPMVYFTVDEGVTVSGYSCLQNDDFMVADPALDQSGNALTNYYEHIGVPTLFRHKTAQIRFKVKTKKAYSNIFTLKDISFVSVPMSGDYAQNATTSGIEKWSVEPSTATTPHYSSSTGTIFADSEVAVEANGTKTLIPQSFSDGDAKMLRVSYTISSGTSSTPKTKTAEISMFQLLGGSSTVPQPAIEMGKIYTFTLIFSGSEITWNPEVVDWNDQGKNVTVSE